MIITEERFKELVTDNEFNLKGYTSLQKATEDMPKFIQELYNILFMGILIGSENDDDYTARSISRTCNVLMSMITDGNHSHMLEQFMKVVTSAGDSIHGKCKPADVKLAQVFTMRADEDGGNA